MPSWQVLPWVVLALMVCIGTTSVHAAMRKDPRCVALCVAVYRYCELQDQVTEDRGIATCVTATVAHGGCSDLLTAAGTACPQPVTDARACTQAVAAAERCLHTCAEKLATDTCDSPFSTCFKGS